MRASQCLFNPATALCKLFISNAAALENPRQLQRLLLPSRTVPIQLFSPSSQRHFSVYHARMLNSYQLHRREKIATEKAASRGTMRDYDIVFPWIQLRQPDGSLSPPQRTHLVLKDLNLELDTLILLATPRPDDLTPGPEYPICRIADRKAELAAEAERLAMRKSTPKITTKKLEINWAIAPHDLRLRMARLKEFLGKGFQVQVTLRHPKLRRKKRADHDQSKVVLKQVESVVSEVPGAKETKPREGTLGEMLVLLLQVPPSKLGNAPTETAPAATEEAPAEGKAEAETTPSPVQRPVAEDIRMA
ncbi:hypothetical protein CHGG_07825 [Chaetomium globosum CBS 148.51]|uniref:Translation initiation factor 3 C-terminal domain-containing protein n=1 Tax=Chaetomium globosum (strain ATCC 6205 / CBS 148.51 / DSM 1962 / NBRC 6347 / NRRL 1970) TaxID=306901 RepID=Q2GW29_CHAGB|nr:uncharacterized protein CHGG_07825 [Chaetomium globosum CBS 148.51]EAQ86572.1 hypothetical protein CHGG_07825 [Chaetomium globosum CBS 148.51]